MASRCVTTLILAMMVLAVIPMPASAGDSGGVQASESSVGIGPQSPVEGGSVIITLTLQNTNNFEAEDVLYKLYWDGVATNQLLTANTVDIPAESTTDIQFVQSGLTVGEHKVWIIFEYNNGGEQMFYREIIVSGLADLEASLILTSPSSLNSGDSVLISTEISNTGSQDAESSRMMIDLGSQNQILNVPSILAGESTWVNHSMSAPSAGEHLVEVTVDLDDAVTEADENNMFNQPLTVVPRMDLSHMGDISIEAESGNLQGPWTVSGILQRTRGSGVTEVPMVLEIQNQNGQYLPLPVFNINISGGDVAQQSWSYSLNYEYISSLVAGNHQLTVAIDPYQSANFTQESVENDRSSGYFDKFAVPDVSVDPIASPSKNPVKSGNNVDWTVTISNSGQIEVKGKLFYTWEGVQVEPSPEETITIQPGDSFSWEKTLTTESGSHDASFEAEWFPLESSYDAVRSNSKANGNVTVTAELKLTWSKASMSLVDSNGEAAVFPLMAGDEYTVSIKVAAQETGTVNYSCENELNEIFEVIPIVVVNDTRIYTVNCTFKATAPFTNINLIPSEGTVSDDQSWNWDSKEPTNNVAEEAGNMTFQTAGMIALICMILIGVLVAAVILTRESDEEVERDIFDYCPACDGELDDDVDRCPSCSFNLKKARKQFHDCESCKESIPDLLSNCPYCGVSQDTSKYFEKRERRIVEKKTIALIDDEEVDPETIHAAGYEGFDEAVKEFGYDADDLEGHWDESIAKAEAEVEAAYDRKTAAEEVDLDDEDAMATVTTTLKSIDETFEGHDIDAILSKRDMKAHLDDGEELSASDAEIRGRLFEITGEDGVMPGDEVNIGMGIQDRSLAGNVLPEDAMDFSLDDDDDDDDDADELNPVAKVVAESKRRRGVRRKSKQTKTAECGACGADIPAEANECSTCGAKFE
tara:strand:+ start:96 stop:2879 length:2784 start_codon:yes stop_codon:yes gene_type:complete